MTKLVISISDVCFNGNVPPYLEQLSRRFLSVLKSTCFDVDEACVSIRRNNGKSEVVIQLDEEPAKVEVFSRPECVFNYCPNPAICQDFCRSATTVNGITDE